MPNSEKIHALELADALEVTAILQRHYQSPMAPMGGAWSLPQVEQELRMGRGRGLWVDGQLRAFILYRESPLEIDISVLATDHSEVRKGYMKRLLTNFLAEAREWGREVWLEVHEGNLMAQKLYEKLGFKKVGERTGYYRDGATAWLFLWR